MCVDQLTETSQQCYETSAIKYYRHFLKEETKAQH